MWSQFAHRLSRIHADKAEMVVEVPRTAPLGGGLAGRQLFTRTATRVSRRTVAPARARHIDGADDGLAWKTPDGLRRTRLLRGELATGPYGWMGEHQTLKEHAEITLKNLKGKGLPETDLANLLTYVQQMKRPKVRPEADIERGKRVFATAECSHCHTAGSTDRQVHDVGTGGSFLTPTLVSLQTRVARCFTTAASEPGRAPHRHPKHGARLDARPGRSQGARRVSRDALTGTPRARLVRRRARDARCARRASMARRSCPARNGSSALSRRARCDPSNATRNVPAPISRQLDRYTMRSSVDVARSWLARYEATIADAPVIVSPSFS